VKKAIVQGHVISSDGIEVDKACWRIYYVILYPYLLIFRSFNNIILEFLLVLFSFIGNKLNSASIVKRGKRGQ